MLIIILNTHLSSLQLYQISNKNFNVISRKLAYYCIFHPSLKSTFFIKYIPLYEFRSISLINLAPLYPVSDRTVPFSPSSLLLFLISHRDQVYGASSPPTLPALLLLLPKILSDSIQIHLLKSKVYPMAKGKVASWAELSLRVSSRSA